MREDDAPSGLLHRLPLATEWPDYLAHLSKSLGDGHVLCSLGNGEPVLFFSLPKAGPFIALIEH